RGGHCLNTARFMPCFASIANTSSLKGAQSSRLAFPRQPQLVPSQVLGLGLARGARRVILKMPPRPWARAGRAVVEQPRLSVRELVGRPTVDPEREQRVAVRSPVHPHGGADEGVQMFAVPVSIAVVSHHRVVDIAGQQLVVLVSREKFYARVVAPGSFGRHHFRLNGPATWSARSRRGSKSKFKAFKAAIMPSRAARSTTQAGFCRLPP